MIFTLGGENLEDFGGFSVSLWEADGKAEKSEEEEEYGKYFSMGYSKDRTLTVPYNYRIPVGANIKAKPRAGNTSSSLTFFDDILFTADTFVYFDITTTPRLNGLGSEDSSFTIKNIFGETLFKQSPKVFNQDLAELALTGCIMSYPRKGIPPDANVIEYLKKMDFKDIEIFNYYDRKEEDKYRLAGFAMGHRKIIVNGQFFDLVFVVIRGTVEEEWYSNFNIGRENIHAGFADASHNVHEIFKEYLRKHSLNKPEETKVLITGHSRGASVSSILAGSILQKKEIDKRNLYVYTFAAPNFIQDIANKEDYNNIWNIVNSGDLVPVVPIWGFERYGNNILSDSFTEEQLEMAQQNFFNMTGFKYVGFKDEETRTAIEEIEKLAPTVKGYYETVYSGKKIFNMKSMTTYEYCNYMADVIIKGKVGYAMKSPREFNGIEWFFIKTGALRPAVMQSHSLEYYLSLLYANKNEVYVKSDREEILSR